MAWWSPGASPNSSSSASSRVASAKPKPGAASPPSFPSKRNFFSPPRKSIAPVLSSKPAARSKPWPPSCAVGRYEAKSIIPASRETLRRSGLGSMTDPAASRFPAVANILTKATEYDFFMDPVPVEGAGSGFVIDARGYILTNFHVVQEAQSIDVVLGDQSRFPAKFIGADRRNDVALLKIDPKGKHLAALPLGDSGTLQVGQKVLAIGNPFGFQSTLTTGVVSALGRTVQTSQTTFIDEAIQTDAAINRGNSGGPLINSHGEVIGINSAIYTPTGTTAGIGFAIPINTAKNIANDLMTDGRVHRAFLGVETLPIGGWLGEALDLPVKEGLLVTRATKGAPAAAAGIQGGNRVVEAGMRRIYIGG